MFREIPEYSRFVATLICSDIIDIWSNHAQGPLLGDPVKYGVTTEKRPEMGMCVLNTTTSHSDT